MKKIVNLLVNGDSHEVAIEPQETLLNTLRDQLELRGTKRGCDSGGCGCCTVGRSRRVNNQPFQIKSDLFCDLQMGD